MKYRKLINLIGQWVKMRTRDHTGTNIFISWTITLEHQGENLQN